MNLTATVSVTGYRVIPTGSVTFWNGDAQIGTAVNLNAQGKATLTITTLTTGTYTIQAVFIDSTTYNTSTSNPLNVIIK